MTVQQWVDAYAQAWRDRDADAAAALFTDDGSYREHPLQEAHRGAEGVRRVLVERHRDAGPRRRADGPAGRVARTGGGQRSSSGSGC